MGRSQKVAGQIALVISLPPMRSRRGTRKVPLYTLEGRRIREELRGCNVQRICDVSGGLVRVRVLNGPLAPKVQDVPSESVTPVSPEMLTRHDILVRVVVQADDNGSCRLCGRTHAPGTMAHEADCPIPAALEYVERRSKTKSCPTNRGRIKRSPRP